MWRQCFLLDISKFLIKESMNFWPTIRDLLLAKKWLNLAKMESVKTIFKYFATDFTSWVYASKNVKSLISFCVNYFKRLKCIICIARKFKWPFQFNVQNNTIVSEQRCDVSKGCLLGNSKCALNYSFVVRKLEVVRNVNYLLHRLYFFGEVIHCCSINA